MPDRIVLHVRQIEHRTMACKRCASAGGASWTACSCIPLRIRSDSHSTVTPRQALRCPGQCWRLHRRLARARLPISTPQAARGHRAPRALHEALAVHRSCELYCPKGMLVFLSMSCPNLKFQGVARFDTFAWPCRKLPYGLMDSIFAAKCARTREGPRLAKRSPAISLDLPRNGCIVGLFCA